MFRCSDVPIDGPMVLPHDEILQNLLMLKTGYIKIALRLEVSINLVIVIIYIVLNFLSLWLSIYIK
jgi:hypothetical protein